MQITTKIPEIKIVLTWINKQKEPNPTVESSFWACFLNNENITQFIDWELKEI